MSINLHAMLHNEKRNMADRNPDMMTLHRHHECGRDIASIHVNTHLR